MKGQTARPPEGSGDLPPEQATATSSTAATEWNEAGHRLAGLQTILDSMTDIVLGFDSQGRLVQANAALQQLLGMDVTGVTFERQAALFHKFGVSHPDGQPVREHDRHVLRALQGATIPDKIYRITAADGRKTAYSCSSAPITVGGKIVGSVTVGHDITERVQAADALRASEERYRLLAETMLQGVVHQDADGKIIAMNPAAERILGMTREELQGSSSLHLENQTIRENGAPFPGLEHPAMVALRTGQPVHGVIMGVFNPQRGAYRWISIDAVPSCRAGEACVAEVCAVFEDITERKQADELLRASEQRIQQALQVSHSFTFEWYQPTDQVLRSASCANILGLSNDEACHDTGQHFFQRIHPDDRGRFTQMLHDLTPAANTYTIEYRATRGDGGLVVLEEMAQGAFDEAGHLQRLVGVATDITTRKQAEAAARSAADMFSRTFQGNATAMALSRLDNAEMLDINDRWAELTGFSREEIIGRTTTELGMWKDPTIRGAMVREVQLHGSVRDQECTCFHKNGQAWVAMFSAHVITIGGERVIVSSALDITVRKQSEDELRKLSRALEYSPAATVITDTQGRIEYVNPAFTTITGYSAAEAAGQSPRMLKSGHHPPAFYKALWDTIQAGQAWQGEFCNRKKNGGLYWEAAAIAPILDAQGTITHFVAVKEDITEQKQVAAALRASQAQLRQTNEALEERVRERTANLAQTNQQLELTLNELRDSEELYRALVDTTPDFIYSLDNAGRHTAVNRALCEALGLPESQLIGHTHAELGFDDASVHLRSDLHRRALNGEIVHAELVTTLPRGAQRTFDVSLQPIRGPTGAVIGVRGRSRDITDQRKAEAQALQSQKLEAVGILAGGVAHDFNNLLTIILGYAESLLREIHAGDPLQLDVREIQDAGLRAASLTRQLLAFSRKQALQPEVLNLNAVVRNLEKMLRRLIGEDILFQTALADDLEHVRADPGQLEQVIMNLVVNARDAMPQGGTLTLATRNVQLDEHAVKGHSELSPGPHILLAISDTGCGMDERTKAKVFEPFFTTKEKGKGTGLGLSTVYGIVKQSGGSIELDSAPRQGATFKIYLPRVAAATTAPAKKPVATTEGQGETILLVEDDDALRGLFQAQVKALGYRTCIAANGGEAVLAVEEKGLRPDLLLSDVVMPGMSGAVLAKRLLKTQPKLKVLFMSGYTEDAIEHHGVRDLDKPLLTKPFNFDTLARKIREVLDAEQSGAGSVT